MKLYVGGIYQGQAELAQKENPGAQIINDFHEKVRSALSDGKDPRAFALETIKNCPDAVIVADEVGSGVVPMAAEDRAWREAAGRALCLVAQASETVTRVVCGIGVKIK